PFAAPPAALAPGEQLYELVQETLRGPAMASLPFYDRAKVVALLDELPALDIDGRAALDPVLMILLSACCLHQRYFQCARATPTGSRSTDAATRLCLLYPTGSFLRSKLLLRAV